HLLAQLYRGGARDHPSQILLYGADIGSDGHSDVVAPQHPVTTRMPGDVDRLVGKTTGERAVAHHGDHGVGLPFQIPRGGDPEGCGEGGTRVPRSEVVVDALVTPQESR